MSLSNISVAQLKRAVVLRGKLDRLERELAEILGEPSMANGPGGRRKMSAAGRAKIAAGQRLRWAKLRKGSPGAVKAAKKGGRKMSAATKAKLAAIARARWAKVKASHRRTLAG